MADKYEEMSSEFDDNDDYDDDLDGDFQLFEQPVLQRTGNNAALRSYVIALSKVTILCFGTPLHTTLATIAQVAFNRDFPSKDQVREWLRA